MRDAVVEKDVLDHRRLAIQHHPAADAEIHGKPHPLPKRSDRVLVGVEAFAVVAEHERRSIRSGQASGGTADYLLDLRQAAREGEVLNC